MKTSDHESDNLNFMEVDEFIKISIEKTICFNQFKNELFGGKLSSVESMQFIVCNNFERFLKRYVADIILSTRCDMYDREEYERILTLFINIIGSAYRLLDMMDMFQDCIDIQLEWLRHDEDLFIVYPGQYKFHRSDSNYNKSFIRTFTEYIVGVFHCKINSKPKMYLSIGGSQKIEVKLSDCVCYWEISKQSGTKRIFSSIHWK
eukprot:217067_1